MFLPRFAAVAMLLVFSAFLTACGKDPSRDDNEDLSGGGDSGMHATGDGGQGGNGGVGTTDFKQTMQVAAAPRDSQRHFVAEQTGLIRVVRAHQSTAGGQRGKTIPSLRGRYIFADASSGRIWSLALSAGGVLDDLIEHTVEITAPVVTSIENGPGGEIYLTSRVDNALYRLDPL